MKTLLSTLVLAATLTAMAEDVTTVKRYATKVIPSKQLDAIFDGARAMGITADGEFVTTTNLVSLWIRPQGTNYSIMFQVKPEVITTSVTNNGLVVMTERTTRAIIPPYIIEYPVMKALFDAGVGVVGDKTLRVHPRNFQQITINQPTNSVDWTINILLK